MTATSTRKTPPGGAAPVQHGGQPGIHTIGHSNLGLGEFMANLERNGIRTVADVRSTPQSRHVPHFNRDRLERALEKSGIRYHFMGDALGGRPSSSRMYDEQGRVRYDRIAREDNFQNALRELQRIAQKDRTAVMCTEGDPLSCHRTLLVAHELSREGIEVTHIMTDGAQMSHHQLMDRLMDRKPHLQSEDMNREQLVEKAVQRQADQVCYRRRTR